MGPCPKAIAALVCFLHHPDTPLQSGHRFVGKVPDPLGRGGVIGKKKFVYLKSHFPAPVIDLILSQGKFFLVCMGGWRAPVPIPGSPSYGLAPMWTGADCTALGALGDAVWVQVRVRVNEACVPCTRSLPGACKPRGPVHIMGGGGGARPCWRRPQTPQPWGSQNMRAGGGNPWLWAVCISGRLFKAPGSAGASGGVGGLCALLQTQGRSPEEWQTSPIVWFLCSSFSPRITSRTWTGIRTRKTRHFQCRCLGPL